MPIYRIPAGAALVLFAICPSPTALSRLHSSCLIDFRRVWSHPHMLCQSVSRRTATGWSWLRLCSVISTWMRGEGGQTGSGQKEEKGKDVFQEIVGRWRAGSWRTGRIVRSRRSPDEILRGTTVEARCFDLSLQIYTKIAHCWS